MKTRWQSTSILLDLSSPVARSIALAINTIRMFVRYSVPNAVHLQAHGQFMHAYSFKPCSNAHLWMPLLTPSTANWIPALLSEIDSPMKRAGHSSPLGIRTRAGFAAMVNDQRNRRSLRQVSRNADNAVQVWGYFHRRRVVFTWQCQLHAWPLKQSLSQPEPSPNNITLSGDRMSLTSLPMSGSGRGRTWRLCR